SSRSSCLVIFSLLRCWWCCQGTSIAASRASAPTIAKSAVSARSTPPATEASSEACGMVSRVENARHTTQPPMPPIRPTRSSERSSSARLSLPYTRARPLPGLSRAKSGCSALPAKRSPPIAAGAIAQAASAVSISGSSGTTRSSSRPPACGSRRSGESSSVRSKLSAPRIQSREAAPTLPPVAFSASTAQPSTATLPSSRERGTWPFSRASRSRFSLGCSVRSSLEACSLIAASSGQCARGGEGVFEQLPDRRGQLAHQQHQQGQADQQRHRQADRDRVELGGGAGQHAEGDVHRQQRHHHRQRQQRTRAQAGGEEGRHRRQQRLHV